MSEQLPYSDRLRLIKLGLLPKEAVAKKKQPIKKISDKKKQQVDAEKKERGGGETELTKWFRSKIKISSGVCSECGCRVETSVFKYAVMTVAHLLPKRDNMCPSVKTHPLNYIILCPDHHHQYDNSTWEEKEKMGCWPIIQERLIMIYPDLHPSERRHFPVEKAFGTPPIVPSKIKREIAINEIEKTIEKILNKYNSDTILCGLVSVISENVNIIKSNKQKR